MYVIGITGLRKKRQLLVRSALLILLLMAAAVLLLHSLSGRDVQSLEDVSANEVSLLSADDQAGEYWGRLLLKAGVAAGL